MVEVSLSLLSVTTRSCHRLLHSVEMNKLLSLHHHFDLNNSEKRNRLGAGEKEKREGILLELQEANADNPSITAATLMFLAQLQDSMHKINTIN